MRYTPTGAERKNELIKNALEAYFKIHTECERLKWEVETRDMGINSTIRQAYEYLWKEADRDRIATLCQIDLYLQMDEWDTLNGYWERMRLKHASEAGPHPLNQPEMTLDGPEQEGPIP